MEPKVFIKEQPFYAINQPLHQADYHLKLHENLFGGPEQNCIINKPGKRNDPSLQDPILSIRCETKATIFLACHGIDDNYKLADSAAIIC